MDGKIKGPASSPLPEVESHSAHADCEHSLPTTVRAAHETTYDDDWSALPVPAPVDAEASHWEEATTVAPEVGADAVIETSSDPRIPADQAFFKIGEVSKVVGVKPYVLRYWEGELAGIQPEKTSTRQRRYRREDVAMLLKVCRLRHDEKLSIARIRVLIRRGEGASAPIAPVATESVATVAAPPAVSAATRAALHSELQQMRQAVMALLESVED